ncbi:MAG: phage tail protein [Exilibacterium sp.]
MQTLDSQIDRLNRYLKSLHHKAVPAAYASAMNKSLARIRTRLVRGVSKREKIPAKHIRKRVFIRRATARTLRGRLSIYVEDIPVISLLRDQTPTTGRKRRIRAAGRVYHNAFIRRPQKSKGRGKPHVFQRQSTARYPIAIQKIAIDKPVKAVTPVVIRRVMRHVHPRLLRHELRYRIDKHVR